ncbi:InlB B-repeat-containing protein [Enterococcus olivae]
MKKLKNKKVLIIGVSVILTICILCVGTYIGYQKIYLPSLKDVTVSVFKDNGIKINELSFKESSSLKILDEQGEFVNEIDLDEETGKVTLYAASSTKSLLLDDWEFEEKVLENGFLQRDEIYYTAKPMYLEKQDFVLTFITGEHSRFYEKDQPLNYVSQGYKAGTNLQNSLLTPSIDSDYKGFWTIEGHEITDETVIYEDTVLEFRTYQDKNDNGIDDFSEEFELHFVTNTEEEIESRVVTWEETIDLPVLQTLKEENKVFYDWYADEQMTEVFTSETKITNDMTLFAKVEYIPDIINTTIEYPISRNDIAIEVQKVLNEQNKKVDEGFNQEIQETEKERAEVKAYNEENNIVNNNVEQVVQLHNLGQNKLYLITFLDPLNNYLYSIVAPYGQTLKVVYEDGQLYKEYAIRQDTTIVLDQKVLLTESSELERYDFEYRQINESVFIKLQPVGV